MPRIRHALGRNTSEAAVAAVAGSIAVREENASTSEPDASIQNDRFEQLRDLLSRQILQAMTVDLNRGLERKRNRRLRKASLGTERLSNTSRSTAEPPPSAEELEDFIEYLATEIFDTLPEALRTHVPNQEDATNDDELEILIQRTPTPALDCLSTYTLERTPEAIHDFLADLYRAYLASPSHPPDNNRPPDGTKCALCERDHIDLSVHHLVPRAVHDKAVKRGWVADLAECRTRTAWLCRACHSFVHRAATHEELARRYNTIEALEGREDVRRWAAWVGRVRWKKR